MSTSVKMNGRSERDEMNSEFRCYMCECSSCRISYRCEECKTCNGSSEKPAGSCAEKVPMEISPQIAIAALELVLNVRDPGKLAGLFMAAEEAR